MAVKVNVAGKVTLQYRAKSDIVAVLPTQMMRDGLDVREEEREVSMIV